MVYWKPHLSISLEKGYKVFVIDSFANSNPIALRRVLEILKLQKRNLSEKLKIFKCDLRNKVLLENIFHEILRDFEEIHGVIHFAGLKAVAESVSSPLEYWNVNVGGTINLLDLMQKYDCNTFVFSSSATIYSQSNNSLLSEDSEVSPINPYGTTKLTIERLLEDLFKSSNKYSKFACLRYFNPIGAHSSGLIGENPIGKPNNIFPLIINAALGISKKFEVFGNDWPTLDGTAIRDYIHVMDVADAHIKVLENLFLNESSFLKFNIGTGKGTSVMELLKIFERVNNIKVPYVFSGRRSGDACTVVADVSFVKSVLKINPKMTIEDMCRDGFRWKN